MKTIILSIFGENQSKKLSPKLVSLINYGSDWELKVEKSTNLVLKIKI